MIFFVDIDGTIRDYAEGIMPSAVAALEAAKKNGHTLILCTGRTIGMIPYDVPLALFDGMIAGGGCYVSYHDRVLRDEHIPDATVKRYRDYFDSIDAPYGLESIKGIFMNEKYSPIVTAILLSGEDPDTSEKAGLRTERIRSDKTLDEFDSLGIYATKISFCLLPGDFAKFSVPDEDGLTLIHFTDDFDEYEHCELVRSDCDKGAALRFLCESAGLEGKTVAIGDSMNDVSVMKAADIGVCMGNATDEVKGFADMVTDDVKEDGFYNALVRLQAI
ncbi:MAG: HAD family hydrolase [Oscillospiraceae bacterium]|nr:HAD family hydrolase [Oscillospiraceae bacterium]